MEGGGRKEGGGGWKGSMPTGMVFVFRGTFTGIACMGGEGDGRPCIIPIGFMGFMGFIGFIGFMGFITLVF